MAYKDNKPIQRVEGEVTISGGSPTTIADGADVTQGAIADAAVVTDASGTLGGKLRGLVKWAYERMPASLGQQSIADSLSVVIASGQMISENVILEIRKGNVPGHSIISGMGEYESGTTTAGGEDVTRWAAFAPDGPARLPTPNAAGEQMTVVSDDDADNGATATGVLTVRIHYIDAAGSEQQEDLTLDGTTPVNTVATDIRFVNDFHALTVGANGVAEGNLAVYMQGGSIPNNLYSMIAAGGNMSLVPHKMVPLGKTLYLMGWHAEEAQAKRAAFRIRSTDHNGVLFPGVFLFKDAAYMNQSSSGERILHATPVPALSIVKVSHWDGSVGSDGSCGWWGILVDD